MASGRHTQDRGRTARTRAGLRSPLRRGEAEGTERRRALPTGPSSRQAGRAPAAGEGGAVTSSARGTWWPGARERSWALGRGRGRLVFVQVLYFRTGWEMSPATPEARA